MRRLLQPGRARRVLARLAGTALFAIATAALATAPAAASTATLTLSSTKPSLGPGVELVAQVNGAPAAALRGLTVDFYVHLEEFTGAPELLVGAASTNAAGVASITYQPTWAGTQRFAATALDSTGSTLASATLTVQAARTDPFAGPIESLRPDGLIGRWVVVALLLLLLGVWVTLLALVVRVQQGPARTPQ